MGRPNHFEIPVEDPDRAEKFYGDVFGWSFQRYEGAPTYYGMVSTGEENPGINGALFQRDKDSVVTLTMGVDDIEAAAKQVEASGGTVLVGKTPVPGMGWFATCRDTEGNKFGLWVDDTNAG